MIKEIGTAVLDRRPSRQFAANVSADQHGPPDALSFFGSPRFARSATNAIVTPLVERHGQRSSIVVVGLGAGTGFYDSIVGESIASAGLRPQLIVTDLNPSALAYVPRVGRTEDRTFPITALEADATALMLPDGAAHAVTSRAVEHYLPEETQRDLIREAGRLLDPGGIYAAQIMTGSPFALDALSADLKVLVGKEVKFFSLDEYRSRVASVTHTDGSPVFRELTTAYAEPQTYRGVITQAERNLTERFLEVHAEDAGNMLPLYREEVSDITTHRKRLNGEVLEGIQEREEAVAELDKIIESKQVYSFFKDICITSILTYLRNQGIQPRAGMDLPGIRLEGEGARITDVALEFEFPIVVLEKQAPIFSL
jgi:SAM-dependent methyltransferase